MATTHAQHESEHFAMDPDDDDDYTLSDKLADEGIDEGTGIY